MIAKLKSPLIDVGSSSEIRRYIHAFGSWRDMVVLAIHLSDEGVFLWFDSASSVIPVPLRLLDITDGTLSRLWVATSTDHGVLIAPPDLAIASFEVDAADRDSTAQQQYAKTRDMLFSEQGQIP